MSYFRIISSVDPIVKATLQKGERIQAESNAMVAMDATLSLQGQVRGGFLKSLARKFLNDETFFQQKVVAENGTGSIWLSPNLPGDVALLEVGQRQYMLSDGAFLAASSGVQFRTKMQSVGRAILGDSGGFFLMKTEGQGQVVVSGFGSLQQIELQENQTLIVDNGHLVAWDAQMSYELSINTSRSGLLGKILHSQLSGEGIVLKFRGPGHLLICSRNKGGFLSWILSAMPQEKVVRNDEA